MCKVLRALCCLAITLSLLDCSVARQPRPFVSIKSFAPPLSASSETKIHPPACFGDLPLYPVYSGEEKLPYVKVTTWLIISENGAPENIRTFSEITSTEVFTEAVENTILSWKCNPAWRLRAEEEAMNDSGLESGPVYIPYQVGIVFNFYEDDITEAPLLVARPTHE